MTLCAGVGTASRLLGILVDLISVFYFVRMGSRIRESVHASVREFSCCLCF